MLIVALDRLGISASISTMANHIETAFNELVSEPIPCSVFYVVLWRKIPFYGGPEEGGWWGSDDIPEKYTVTATEAEATVLFQRIHDLAEKLSEEARHDHGRACQAQLEWCEERGIDDSNSIFGEDDGPESFYVTVEESLPKPCFGTRHYE